MTTSKPITFRVSGKPLHDLQALASIEGKSEGELAKGFTIEALTSKDGPEPSLEPPRPSPEPDLPWEVSLAPG